MTVCLNEAEKLSARFSCFQMKGCCWHRQQMSEISPWWVFLLATALQEDEAASAGGQNRCKIHLKWSFRKLIWSMSWHLKCLFTYACSMYDSNAILVKRKSIYVFWLAGHSEVHGQFNPLDNTIYEHVHVLQLTDLILLYWLQAQLLFCIWDS